MRKVLCVLIFQLAIASSNSQVSIGSKNPDPSAMLDISSSSKGLLVPRMTQSQRMSIKNPANGLMVFQTDGIFGFYCYHGNIWQRYVLSNNPINPGTNTKIAFDSKGLVTNGSDATTNDIPESVNLYFTESRVRNTKLNSVSYLSDSIINTNDNIVSSISKLQSQIISMDKLPSGKLNGEILFWNGLKWDILNVPSVESSLVYCDGNITWGGCFSSIKTSIIKNVTSNSVMCGGVIIKSGGTQISEKGLVWSTDSMPTIEFSTKKSFGSGLGDFYGNISGLTSSTTYYIRSYAINEKGISYGNQIEFTTDSINLNSELVAYYPFNNNTKDESGFNNDGVNINTQLTNDRFGNQNSAVYLDGNSYIQVNHSGKLNLTNGTISFWFKTDKKSYQSLFYKTNPGNPTGETIAIDMENVIRFNVKYNSDCQPGVGWEKCVSNEIFSDNNFHHFVGLIKSDSIVFYIDGIQRGSSIVPNVIPDICQNSPLFIGRDWMLDNSHYFVGSIDDIRIYNRVLTENEVLFLANN